MTTRVVGFLTACVVAVVPVAGTQQRPEQSFNSNDVPIHYADSGRGVPVLLLHGFTGSYARHWGGSGVMKALETGGYRVIAMDCRGHGQSGKPRARACASAFRMGQALREHASEVAALNSKRDGLKLTVDPWRVRLLVG